MPAPDRHGNSRAARIVASACRRYRAVVSTAASRPVLVVGAGPVGLVTALLLARRDVPVIVLERRERPSSLPRAVHLDDMAVRVLQAAGVADAFVAASRPATGLRLLDAQLRPFAVFPRSRSGSHGRPESVLFDQPVLEDLLRAEVAAHPLVDLRPGRELLAVHQWSGGVRILLTRRGVSQSPESVAGWALLGCDGAASTVRDAIGVRWRELAAGQRWFVVDVRATRPLPTWGGVDQVCDPRRAATFMALTGDRYRWEFRMLPGETAPGLESRLGELTARWHPPPLDVVRAAEYTFGACLADRWRDRRVLLLGDAAHLMPPFIGQGIGAGLRDAHNLAWKLAAVRNGADEALLQTYEQERAPHARAVIRGAVRVGRAMSGGQDLAAALRRPLVASLLRLPFVRARATRGIEDRIRAGALVDRRRHRRDLAGTSCPQPTVSVDGAPVRFDEVLGDGYALLHTGPPPAVLRERAAVLGARTVDLDALPGGDVLVEWLRGGRATAALIRPDRFVAATGQTRRSSAA